MAESADFELKLLDAASGPAKRVADALRGVVVQTDKAQQSLGRIQSLGNTMNEAFDAKKLTAASKAMAAQETAIRKIGIAQSQGYSMNAKMDTAASKARDKAAAVIQKASERKAASEEKAAARTAVAVERQKAREAAAIRRTGLLQLEAQKEDKQRTYQKSFGYGLKSALGLGSPGGLTGRVMSGAFWGNIAASAVSSLASGVTSAFASAASGAVSILTDGVKMAFAEGGKAENLRLSYRLLLGAQGGKNALADINGFAGKTKYDDDQIAEIMRPLFNAGLRGQGARSAFAASGDLEAAGLGSASDFIEQFAKIQLKGGVTDKLLVGMGVNLRDFKDALAKETGITNKDTAYKQATEGKLDPQAIMNAIFRGIEKRQGGKIGTGTELASQTMSARLQKIQDLPSQYLKKVSESPAWDALSERLGGVLKSLDPDSERGQAIVGRLTSMFRELVDWANEALTPENLDTFVTGLKAALQSVQTIASAIISAVNVIAHPLDASTDELKYLASGFIHPFSDDADLAANPSQGMKRQSLSDIGMAPLVAASGRGGRMSSTTVNGGINIDLSMANVDDPMAAGKMVADAVAKRLAQASTQGGG